MTRPLAIAVLLELDAGFWLLLAAAGLFVTFLPDGLRVTLLLLALLSAFAGGWQALGSWLASPNRHHLD